LASSADIGAGAPSLGTDVPSVGVDVTADTAPVDSGASESPVQEGSQTATAAPSDGSVESPAPEFDWDSWDGKHDVLPEQLREYAPKFEAYYTKEAQAQMAETARMREIYEAMLEGREDPRLTELQQKYETETSSARELREKYEATQREFEAFKAEQEQAQLAQATAQADAFKKQNAWIFENEEFQRLGGELLNEGFEPDELPVLLRQHDDVLARAREIMKDLTAKGAKNVGEYAINTARAEFVEPKRPATAAAVSGAKGGGNRASFHTQLDRKSASVSDLAKQLWNSHQSVRI
jgi:hypothetical protein